MNPITRTLNVDNLLLLALQEDISSEDVTTNAVMPEACQGTVQLLCKQDGVIAGMEVFARVFTLLDEKTEIIPYVKDGDEVKKGDLLATVNYNWNEEKKCNEIEQITPDGIAEAFVEFAKKEQLSFFADAPLIK